MTYMLLVYLDEQALSESEREKCYGESAGLARDLHTSGQYLAASGVLLTTGDEDRPPVRTTVPQAFLHAGAEAAVGALIAHHARERDGIGQHVDVSAQTAAMMAGMRRGSVT